MDVDERLEHWIQFLDALPFPAALLDDREVVIEANQLVAVPDDLRLLGPLAEGRNPRRSRAGADGQTRWRLVPLAADGSIQLATEEGDTARSHLLQIFFATGQALFVVFDPSGTVLEANDAWKSVLGYDRAEMLGLDAWTLVAPEDVQRHQQDIGREVTETGRTQRLLRVRDHAGDYHEVQWTFHYDAAVDRSFGIGRDVTQEREQERVLKDSHRMFEQVGEFLLSLDLNGVVLSANPALYRTFEIDPAEIVGHPLSSFVHPDDQGRIVEAALEARTDLTITERLTRWRSPRQTDWRWIDGTVSFDPEYDRFHIVARDVTAEQELTAELKHRAYTDELTGLANRTRLLETLDDYLTGSATPAVLFCDLDRFKVVNDSLGHQAGDELLRQLAGILESQARSDDSLVARIGGDEFVVLLGNATEGRAVRAAEFILELMNEPFTVAGRPVHAAVSIGITVARPGSGPGPGRTADILFSEADTAAYRAKDLGRGRYAIHDDEMRQEAQRRFEVEVGLRRAVEKDDFVVHYQPIVALPGGGVMGVEALVRWPTADGDLRMPGSFLDVAEDAGLMGQIGARVLTTALRQGTRLAEKGRNLTVSVNVASSQLADGHFADRVMATIENTRFRPENLVLELTESAILANNEANIRTLTKLRATGVRIALDDFGTGFSSLSHLQNLPIDVVKIDRTFVGALNDDVTRAVTSSVVALCMALGLEVILEGIETVDQLSAVEQLGGTKAQGFLFHRPMAAAELEVLLGQRAATPLTR